ncbi:acid protease [Suillus bovinus]|uniref:acid protease n=1 Tax=Suillus bovinus TaxID=48563 RepID=UPI001B87FD3E|nr:acid protease [Suillus bovinus]KAG2140536.1 acid protease [Suillus bovinus]
MKFTAICTLFVVAVVGSPTPPPNIHSNMGHTKRIPLNSRSTAGNYSKVFDPKAVWGQLGFVHHKYSATMGAYQRNTGSPHPLSSRFDVHSVAKRNGNVSLVNYKSDLWYGEIEVGTPPKTFTVVFDTGSSDLFLPSTECGVACDGHTAYDPAASSFSKDSGQPFVLTYGAGETAGEEYVDDVFVGGYEADDQTLGAAWIYSPEFSKDNFPPDGLSGLAFREISEFEGSPLFQTLDESGKLPQSVIGFKLSTTPGDSEMVVGGTNTDLYHSDTLTYVPVTKKGYWQVKLGAISRLGQEVIESQAADAIIDTGTTFVITSYSIAQSYYANISGATAHTEGDDTYWTIPCDTINSTVPTFTFGTRAFKVSTETYNLGPDVDYADCLAGIAASAEMNFTIVGDVFLQNVYSVFDYANTRVGFAELA